MGRPRVCEEERVLTPVRLPRSVRDALRAAAASRDVSVNLLVTRAVTEYLQRLPAIDQQLGGQPAGQLDGQLGGQLDGQLDRGSS